jgi:hypothetical protein
MFLNNHLLQPPFTKTVHEELCRIKFGIDLREQIFLKLSAQSHYSKTSPKSCETRDS